MDKATGSQEDKVVLGGGGGRGGGGGEMDVDNSVTSIRSRRMSKRMSLKEPIHESDRRLKKLFRAIQDGDVNLVKFDSLRYFHACTGKCEIFV